MCGSSHYCHLDWRGKWQPSIIIYKLSVIPYYTLALAMALCGGGRKTIKFL